MKNKGYFYIENLNEKQNNGQGFYLNKEQYNYGIHVPDRNYTKEAWNEKGGSIRLLKLTKDVEKSDLNEELAMKKVKTKGFERSKNRTEAHYADLMTKEQLDWFKLWK